MENGHVVFTSVNRAYLARALTLARSVHTHDPDVHFVLLLVEPALPQDFQSEEVFRDFINKDSFNEILTLNQLDTSAISNFENYSVIEMCTAVKGIASQFLLNREESKIVTYLDPDLYFFTSLEAIRKEHSDSDVLVTPHLNHSPTSNVVIHNDEVAGSMNHGIFNLGFVSFKSSKRSKVIASWWADRLAVSSSADYTRGLFTDQKWWDLSLVYFPDIKVVRNDGWNMAPWNLSERKLISLAPPTLTSGQRLSFFHFSKFPGTAFFDKTSNYSKPELLRQVVAEYSLKFYQATEDVIRLVLSIEELIERPSAKVSWMSFAKNLRAKLSFTKELRKYSIVRLNELLDRYPAIFSLASKYPVIYRNSKSLYRNLISIEIDRELKSFNLLAIESEIGKRPIRVLITHKGGGGVEEVIKFRSSQIARSGVTPAILRPIGKGTFRFSVNNKSFELEGVKELKTILTICNQIEIHHVLGFEDYLDIFASFLIDGIYLHDRYFISQTPFSDALQYGEIDYDVAGVNLPLNVDCTIDPQEWSSKTRKLLNQSRNLYSPSQFLATQFEKVYKDVSLKITRQEDDLDSHPIKKKFMPGVLQIVLISPTNFHKGAESLLEVAKFLETQNSKIVFTVIGDLGIKLSHDLATLSNVDLIPQMSRHRLNLKLSEMQNGIGWIPSLTAESYSLALSDFLSCGFRVVATELGAIEERLRDIPGHFLYDPQSDNKSLAQDFLQFILSDESPTAFQVLKQTKV